MGTKAEGPPPGKAEVWRNRRLCYIEGRQELNTDARQGDYINLFSIISD